ncbi:MAG TPA: xanthine dehydrogenase family protein molybdopterin-binding subunit, partial [Thermomicrobiaceae bacterium]|nr:xanthine dehydrogenase family protein molybdopterin-binding subunit [Thermomicrobiaceae bacterium]
ARITGIDTEAARAVPGVVDIVSGRDILPDGAEPASRAKGMLAVGKVIYYGQPVVAVVAESEAAAEEAAGLVRVHYQSLGANVDPLESMKPGAPVIWPSDADAGEGEAQMHATVSGGQAADTSNFSENVTGANRMTRGDVERGFAEADLIVEHTYHTPSVHQGYMEPHASIAVPDPLGNLTVYTATQGQFYVRTVTADTLGLPQNQVTVIPMEVGGGFGGKTVLLEPLAGALALRSGRPVSLVLTRMEEFLLSTPAPSTRIELKVGGTKDGRITAIKARAIFDGGAYKGGPPTVVLMMIGGNYQCPNFDLEGIEVITNKPATGAYRAPGGPQASFAMEQAVDELARGLGWDPIEFRLHNSSKEGDPQANNTPWPEIALRQILETLRDHPVWKNRTNEPNHGYGLAIGGWPGGVEPCAANCRLNTDGTLSVTLGSIDITGTNTTMAMIAAQEFGVPVEQVKIVTGNTDSAPYAGLSGGSKVTYTVGVAVQAAAAQARQQVLAIAATELEAAPEDLEMVGGVVRVKGSPDREISVAEVAHKSMTFGGKYEPVYGNGKSAVTARAPGFSGQLAHVKVDPDTGEVEILEMVAAQDVGRALNPALVSGQIMGGVTQGIGWALHEGLIYDSNGQPLNPSLMDYSLPNAHQAPPIDVQIIELPSVAGPFGAKGVGEPPIIPTAAAIANAIADATGARVSQLPMTAERVRAAIAGASKNGAA